MIWICTLFLLTVTAWLFFNALNERRWVQAHSHDETVAADEGFLPNFTAITGSGLTAIKGKLSIDEENSRFARAVNKVQEKTSKYSEKFIESKAAAARIDDPENRPASASEENTLFGRAVARIGAQAERIDNKLDARMKAAASQSAGSDDSAADDEGLFMRASRKVATKSDEISQRVAHRAKNMAQGYGEGRSASEEEGLFGKMVGKVSGGMEKLESKVESRMAASRNKDDGDLISRVTAKVGNKINGMDNKSDTAGKETSVDTDKS